MLFYLNFKAQDIGLTNTYLEAHLIPILNYNPTNPCVYGSSFENYT